MTRNCEARQAREKSRMKAETLWVVVLLIMNRCVIGSDSSGHVVTINPLLAECPEAQYHSSSSRGRGHTESLLFGFHSAGNFPDLKRDSSQYRGASVDNGEHDTDAIHGPDGLETNPQSSSWKAVANDVQDKVKQLSSEAARLDWNFAPGVGRKSDRGQCRHKCRLILARYLLNIAKDGQHGGNRGNDFSTFKNFQHSSVGFFPETLSDLIGSYLERPLSKTVNAFNLIRSIFKHTPWGKVTRTQLLRKMLQNLNLRKDKNSAGEEADDGLPVILILLAHHVRISPTHLQHILQWNRNISKRFSLVHPSLLDNHLDFLRSVNNIEPDLLQHVQELTEPGVRQADNMAVRQADNMAVRQADNMAVRQADNMAVSSVSPIELQLGRTGKRWGWPQYGPEGKRRYVRAALDKSGQHPRRVVTDVIRTLISMLEGDSKRYGALGSDVHRLASRWFKKAGMKRAGDETNSSSTSHLPPWACVVSTRWRDMGLHVFPRYVQETDCWKGDNSTTSSAQSQPEPDPPTCYDGQYHCRPTTTAVQVLVRHPGNCNDSRVPVNIRNYYFLSVVNIPTGCVCGP